MIDLSLGEFEALVAKAMRGAGYSWGLTEDGAHAARRLGEFGFSAAEMMLALLRAAEPVQVATLMPNPDWLAPSDWLCPVCVGAAMADRRGCPDADIGPVIVPALAGPIVASTLGDTDQGGYTLTWDGGSVAVTAKGIVATGVQVPGLVPIAIRRDEQLAVNSQPQRRIMLLPSELAELEAFASRTYAPATEESRAGAGSAESDND